MAEKLELFVGGAIYAGWTGIAVTRAIDAASGAFSVSLTERWAGSDAPWPIMPGDTCEVRLDGETIIVGYVDQFRPQFGPEDHSINIQGRDKTADLIDCSAVHDPDEWRNLTALQLATVLAKPFDIKVAADVDVGEVFALAKLQQGETAFDAIARHCQMRKLLAMPDGAGGLLITRAAARRSEVALEQGYNILAASGAIDASQRYSDYVVKAQAGYTEFSDGEGEAHIVGTTTDAGVKRYRPLMIVAEANGTTKTAIDRAVWESKVRLGRSAQASVTVQGWRQKPGGALWAPNTIARIRSSWLRIDGDMLIRQVTYRRDLNNGTICDLDLVSPEAYAPEPIDPEKINGDDNDANVWAEAIR